MLEVIIISLLVFAGCTTSLYCGYKLGKKSVKEAHKHTVAEVGNNTITLSDPLGESIKTGDKIVMFSSDEPSGIIMRPSSEELAKMNEDKDTRESKEEMARVIREAEEPRI